MEHLWEVKHSYYCDRGGMSQHFDSFIEFMSEWGRADEDYNLLVRWDWREGDEDETPDRLLLFYLQQRKGQLFHVSVDVQQGDEDAVKDFLMPKFTYLKCLWSPLG